MRYMNFTHPDVENGLGLRVTLWVAGCSHHCEGCHNPETWSFKAGHEYTEEVEQRLFDRVADEHIKGLTLSGGDPLDSLDDILGLLKRFREKFGNSKDIWVYTGYEIEDIFETEKIQIAQYADYIVEGRFKKELRDISLAFRGSSNQRIVKIVRVGGERDGDGQLAYYEELNLDGVSY